VTERVPIERLGSKFNELLTGLMRHNKEVVGRKVQDMPRRFKVAAQSFYFSVLRVRTGRLRQSFNEFSRKRSSGQWELGLRSDVEYAPVQHWGFSGTVQVGAHARKGGQYGYYGVRAHGRKMNIKPKYFFRDPMIGVADDVMRELKQEIGFK